MNKLVSPVETVKRSHVADSRTNENSKFNVFCQSQNNASIFLFNLNSGKLSIKFGMNGQTVQFSLC